MYVYLYYLGFLFVGGLTRALFLRDLGLEYFVRDKSDLLSLPLIDLRFVPSYQKLPLRLFLLAQLIKSLLRMLSLFLWLQGSNSHRVLQLLMLLQLLLTRAAQASVTRTLTGSERH